MLFDPNETWTINAKNQHGRVDYTLYEGREVTGRAKKVFLRGSTVVDGAINADIFESFVEHVLVPELRPGDVVIMDNLSSHKRVRTRELIEAAGATLEFLPPYSPDLNPIELAFSKLKQLLRSLGLRTRDALWTTMQSVLDRVTASDAKNCFEHCGYSLRMD